MKESDASDSVRESRLHSPLFHSLPLPFPPGTECTTRGESEEPRVGRSVTGGDHEVETAGGRY